MILPDFLSRHPYGDIRLTGHRIDLMHVVDFYNDGYSPEKLHEEFPTLSLELINRVLAFYHDNRAEVDAYVAKCHAEMDRNYANYRPTPGDLRIKRLVKLIMEADIKYAADPQWASLSLPEKVQRVEQENPRETA